MHPTQTANHYDEQMRKQHINQTQSLGPYGKAIKTIHAFRSNYLDFDTDLSTMALLGIKYVRVPVSWCWTDSHPKEMVKVTKPEGDDDNLQVITEFMSDDDVKKKLTCEDPFYPGVRWPASETIERLIECASLFHQTSSLYRIKSLVVLSSSFSVRV
jgi:hypothetical protein